MRTGSESLFVYLQHPHTHEWMTVGRYRFEPGAQMGWFTYSPAYLGHADPVSIDPVSLPLTEVPLEIVAQRYQGLHDVLRDACPDAWGQSLLRLHHGLPEHVHPSRFLALADNADRWGALAVGTGKAPPTAQLSHPRLTQLWAVTDELRAMAERRPAVNAALRKRLTHRSSLGGARPKATVVDAEGRCWLIKPALSSDNADIPRLEHFAMRWAAAAGLDVAPTELHTPGQNASASATRVLRFDRENRHRRMTLSAASLLQLEYPGTPMAAPQRSYPYLGDVLRRIGAPREDGIELFGRMVFNALCGNDDDHARNHAVVYRSAERRWRLAPAYDIVPNPDFFPDRLCLAVASRGGDLSRASLLADCLHFGFESRDAAGVWLDGFLSRLASAFDVVAIVLDGAWRREMHERLTLRLAQWQHTNQT